jgi:hypothetical protein
MINKNASTFHVILKSGVKCDDVAKNIVVIG